jgi:hypothetical protein
LESHKSFQLCSTNPQYPPYMVHANNILEMWKFVNYISKELPDVEVGQSELTKSIKSLQQEMNEIKTMVSK